MSGTQYTVVELCAGAGGQALGLEQAGFENLAAVELDADACITLRRNREWWNVLQADLTTFDGTPYRGADLVAAGVPCPPFSVAGRQLGPDDERDLFPAALRVIEEIQPRAVMFENVRGLASDRFADYREGLFNRLEALGYHRPQGKLLVASDFGVPQLRPRYIIVALREADFPHFAWPEPVDGVVTVADRITDLMASRGWRGAEAWSQRACRVAPTLVGGSKKHGGPDLGPTRARRQWAELGVDGKGIGNEPPGPDLPEDHHPRLTLRMTARLQGFPDDWLFAGGKTAAYRQIGNAFPPPVAEAVGGAIRAAMERSMTAGLQTRQLVMLEQRDAYSTAAG